MGTYSKAERGAGRLTQQQIEDSTQKLGLELYQHVQSYKPSPTERLQDNMMLTLMEDHTLRTRLLRFVDVLPILEKDKLGRKTARLFRQYFRADFSHLPAYLRALIAFGKSPFMPDPVLGWFGRWTTHLIGGRFIVPSGEKHIHGTLSQLQRQGRYPSFDLLGEEVLSDEEATQYKNSYLQMLGFMGKNPLAGMRTGGDGPALEVSLKLSSLVADFNFADPEGTLKRVRPALEEICLAAKEAGIGITVDAEQYSYRELTWHILKNVLSEGGPLGRWQDIGMVVQAYLRDSDRHVQDVMGFAKLRRTPFRVRLVKGAYWDYEVIEAEQFGWDVPVYRDKAATDLAFERLAGTLLEPSSGVHLAVASHNIRDHAYAESVRESMSLPNGTLEHQTLYRTMESLSRGLAEIGWVTRDYVPVGEMIPGMAYLVRRILENTSQVGMLTKTRLHEDTSELLKAPQPGQDDTSYKRPKHHTGFANSPAARLFDAGEREQFEEALKSTRERWGTVYPLQIGSRQIETQERAPSNSPSHTDPATPVGLVFRAGLHETETAIQTANEAASRWAKREIEERSEIGMRAAKLLEARKNEVAAWVVHEGGRTWTEALADVGEAVDHIEWNARQLRLQAPVIEASYQPRGVVACIPPWNFPSALPAGMVSASLLAGNAVILKSAEETPIVALALVNAFHEAGVPKEALIHLPGVGEVVGARLVESPDVDMVTFTGSKKVGTSVYRTVAGVSPTKGGIKQAVTEMGGKNAIVVFADADLDEAVLGIVSSAFGHAGQKCSACSRVLVHRDIHHRLTTRLVEAARSLPIGPADDPGTFINPVISREAKERILGFRKVAGTEGPVLLDNLDNKAGELCLGPLIVEVAPEKSSMARVAQEEIFGPVVTVIPFDSEQQAVDIVNGTQYALTLGIFTRSPETILRMIKACRAGNIYINRGITGARVGIEPFGGFQMSGTGPKTGWEDYIFAFLSRRGGFREGNTNTNGLARPDAAAAERTFRGIVVWDKPTRERIKTLTTAAKILGNSLAKQVLASAPEIIERQPTVTVPGQKNFLTLDTPLGVGLVAVDKGANLSNLPAMVFAALMAGNGVTVVPNKEAEQEAKTLVWTLHKAGVPGSVVGICGPDIALESLGGECIHFAAVDLDIGKTHALNRVMGITDEDSGQRWLKKLITLAEGPRPGEPGFVRRFAHPKVVAIKTLRHGADLELG